MSEAIADPSKFLVAVFADFVCPYSYLTIEQMDRLIDEYGVRVIWRPHWLHPETPPEGTPYEKLDVTPERRAALAAWLKEMAPEQAKRMRAHDKLHYSLLAFEALEFAVDHNQSMPFKSAVFNLLWVDGADIGEVATLQRAAEQVGLDGDELGRALRERRYILRAMAAIEQARGLDITATPTIFLGRTRINGWHYYEVLQSVMDRQGMVRRMSP
jgi:predicted DsbA family dithiol-disulfide isomerase